MFFPKGIILLHILDFLPTDVRNIFATIIKMSLGSEWLSVLLPYDSQVVIKAILMYKGQAQYAAWSFIFHLPPTNKSIDLPSCASIFPAFLLQWTKLVNSSACALGPISSSLLRYPTPHLVFSLSSLSLSHSDTFIPPHHVIHVSTQTWSIFQRHLFTSYSTLAKTSASFSPVSCETSYKTHCLNWIT